MRMRNLVLAAGAATLAAAPVALSHPSTIAFNALVCPSSGSCTSGNMTSQLQYVVLEHGYVEVLKEDNALAHNGVLNLKNLPSGYRRNQTNAWWLTATSGMSHPWNAGDDIGGTRGLTGAADTGAQAHATCVGPAALWTSDNILAWQAGRSSGNPFFNYVPWQGTASGLDDALDLPEWLKVDNAVLSGAGVPNRVSASSTTADFTAACAALGGTYTAQDTVVTSITSASSGAVAEATAPLNTQITDLKAQVASLTEQVAQKTADLEATLAQMNPFSIALKTATVTRAEVGRDGIVVTVNGPVGRTATVVVRTRERVAARLGIPVVLGVAAGAPDASGAVTLKVNPGRGALRHLQAAVGRVPLIAEVQAAQVPGTAKGEIAG